MKQQVYAAWCEGLPKNRAALDILKDSGIVSGVEVRYLSQEEMASVKAAGLKVSLHRPPLERGLGLADFNFIKFFETERGLEVLDSIKSSGSPIAGFHLSFSESSFFDEHSLLETVAGNLSSLERKINKNSSDGIKKVVAESQPFCGSNSFKLKLTDPIFIKRILEHLGMNNSLGYLLDISHNFIVAKEKIRRGAFSGRVSEYFDYLASTLSGKIYQIHINVPSKVLGFYWDSHRIFKERDRMSEEILELTRNLVLAIPELKVLTLEMTTGMGPVAHAKEMVKQAELLLNRIA